MTASNASARAPFYDLFKLIVAVILLLIFLFLFIGGRPGQARLPELIAVTTTSLLPSATVAPASLTPPPPTQLPSPTAIAATSTPPPPTQPPSPTAASIETSTPTPPPVTEEPLPTPIVELTAEPEACAAYARSQLEVGMQATILRRLNFRSSPGIFNNRILTNDPGLRVEVVGGPACTRYANGGAYLWWQIRLPNGLVGWSAEASAFGAFYFMEPVR